MTYVFRTAGQVIGVSLGGAVLQAVLLKRLHAKIHGPGSEEVRPFNLDQIRWSDGSVAFYQYLDYLFHKVCQPTVIHHKRLIGRAKGVLRRLYPL